ncbi:flagellar export protein FliJ [Desulfoplanes formicivorans]|uniref:Flagellar FliJ protein n=1 Tax=Desulfoplanes formicivorans TaxID=1592317 RepID=A0A194ADZ3_9BACT|nr:flagellar export protein FliJ [Desulfoplanes formicivorans]GAU07420.1 flagellar export protein FliJ [Desulfoplanes formicivorans]
MSRSFVFKLASILQYRLQQEEQAQLAFSQAKTRYEHQGRLVRQLMAQQQTCDAQFMQQQSMTQAELWLWGNYKKRIEQDRAQAETLLGEYARDVEKKRSHLIACARDRKLLEKLKTNQAREHANKERALEQKEFDETATLRFDKAGPQTV